MRKNKNRCGKLCCISFNDYFSFLKARWSSQVVLVVKKPPANVGVMRHGFDLEDPLEEGMATHSSFLTRRIPLPEEPSGLQSIGSQRVGHDWSDLAQKPRFMYQNPGKCEMS